MYLSIISYNKVMASISSCSSLDGYIKTIENIVSTYDSMNDTPSINSNTTDIVSSSNIKNSSFTFKSPDKKTKNLDYCQDQNVKFNF